MSDNDWNPNDTITPQQAEAYRHEMFGNCSQDPLRCPHCADQERERQRQLRQATPAKVPATVGTPAPTTAHALEGTTMTQAVSTNGTAVTGVISGAAEARAIHRYLEQATEAYNAAMASARKRIHALGEQTVGVVQMANKSDVVAATAQAAESIAAAQAGVNLCKAETIPLLGQVARSFDRLNS